MRVLVLGAYGLIGLPTSQRLLRDGHTIVGLARSVERGRVLLPDAQWIGADLATLTQPSAWFEYLDHVDVVVNASGVLQAGFRNSVAATQYDAIAALIAACEQRGVTRLIQISAPGVTLTDKTEFFRSKARADEALIASSLHSVILRPGLVLSPQSYGGTGLLRTMAALPWVQPVFLADSSIQTVSVGDVADAVSMSIGGAFDGQDIDLVETESHTLLDITLQIRRWLGFAPPKFIWRVPAFLGHGVAKLADAAGWLGWQSALRSTALSVLADGVRGDAANWTKLRGMPPSSLSDTLRALPSTRQERVSARASLAYPVMIITLSLFWIASGVIGLIQRDAAAATLVDALPDTLESAAVIGGAVADIIVGSLIAFRPTVRLGGLLSLLLAGGYLLGSVVLTPHLWADPLGPMVKVFPALTLALGVMALSEER